MTLSLIESGAVNTQNLAALAETGAPLKTAAQGIDVNALDKWGMTALHHAASKGQLIAVKTLIKAGAICDIEFHGLTPLDFALAAGSNETALELLQNAKQISLNTLQQAVQKGNLDFLVQVSKKIRDLSAVRNERGDTLAHWIVEHREYDTAKKRTLLKLLKDHGSNLCAQNNEGITSLHLAASQKKGKELTQIIARSLDDFHIQDKEGNTPCMWALFEGSPAIAEDEMRTDLHMLKSQIAFSSLICSLRTLNCCLRITGCFARLFCKRPRAN